MYPWNSLLPLALVLLFQGLGKLDEELRQRWYYLSWLFVIFALFTYSGTKLDHYILPITAPLAVLVALLWERYLSADAPRWIAPAMLVSLGFVVLPLRDFLILGNKYLMDAYTNKQPILNADLGAALKLIFGAWALVLVAALFTRRTGLIAALALAVALGNAVYFAHFVLPRQEHVRSVKQYLDFRDQHGGAGSILLFVGKPRHTATYYAGPMGFRHFSRSRLKDAALMVAGKANVFIIAERKYVIPLLGELRHLAPATWARVTSDNQNYDLITNVPVDSATLTR
jgi:hypothetical protein